MKLQPRPKGRDAIKAWNRGKIIDATIEVISRYGIAGTTVARVVKLANVSTGLINSHFRTMDALFDEVLSQMNEEYKIHWQDSLNNAPKNAAAQLKALVLADFDPKVLNQKVIGIWIAFRAQARAKPEYVDLVGTREREQMKIMMSLIRQLNEESRSDYDHEIAASGLTAMLDGIWADYFLYPDDFDQNKGIASVFMFLEALYPGNFSTSGT